MGIRYTLSGSLVWNFKGLRMAQFLLEPSYFLFVRWASLNASHFTEHRSIAGLAIFFFFRNFADAICGVLLLFLFLLDLF